MPRKPRMKLCKKCSILHNVNDNGICEDCRNKMLGRDYTRPLKREKGNSPIMYKTEFRKRDELCIICKNYKSIIGGRGLCITCFEKIKHDGKNNQIPKFGDCVKIDLNKKCPVCKEGLIGPYKFKHYTCYNDHNFHYSQEKTSFVRDYDNTHKDDCKYCMWYTDDGYNFFKTILCPACELEETERVKNIHVIEGKLCKICNIRPTLGYDGVCNYCDSHKDRKNK